MATLTPAKPTILPVLAHNIPDELKRASRRWINWTSELSKKRNDWAKIPHPPGLLMKLPVAGERRKTWFPFQMAIDAYDGKNLYHPDAQPSGVGFVFVDGDGFAGVDLDKCRNPETGELEPWAARVVAKLNSYTEVSPSGKGVKIFLKGTRAKGLLCRRERVEIYVRERYFAVTGQHVPGTPTTIENRQAELDAIAAEFLRDPEPEPKPAASPIYAHIEPIHEDVDLLDRAMRNDRFSRLYHGDISNTDNDHSKADLSLCCSLAFWTHGDEHRMDRLFRASALYRPKWDEHRGKKTYGQITVSKACKIQTKHWNPDAATRLACDVTHATPGVRTPADLLITIVEPPTVPQVIDSFRADQTPALRSKTCHHCCGDDHSADDCPSNNSPPRRRHDPHRFYRPHAPRSQYCGIVKHFGCSFTGRGASPHLLCESRRKCERCQSYLDWQLWDLTDECIVLACLTAAYEGREPLLYRWEGPASAAGAILKRIKRSSESGDGYRRIKQASGRVWILSSAHFDEASSLTKEQAQAELVTAIRSIPGDVKRPWDGSRTWAMPDETPTHDCPACGGDIPRPPAASREMAPSGKMLCTCPHCCKRVEVIPPMRELGITTQVDPDEPVQTRSQRQLEAVGCIVEHTTTDPKARNPVPILVWRLGPQYAGMESVAMRGLEFYLNTCELPPNGDLTADHYGADVMAEQSLSDLLLPGVFGVRVDRTDDAAASSVYGAHPPPN